MESKLNTIYGRSEKFDFLLPGSIWDEPRDWMNALQNKERNLVAIWSDEYESKMTDSIHSVGLSAVAVNANEGFIALEYSFSNKAVAEAEIAALEDEAL